MIEQKKIGIAGVAVAMICALSGPVAMAQEIETELKVLGSYFTPGEDDHWDNTFGGEAQLRVWGSSDAAVALAAGYSAWDARPGLTPTVGDGIEGDVKVIPVGFSFVLSRVAAPQLRISAEGGVRYAFIEADFEVQDAAGATLYSKDDIDIEDTFLVLGGIDAEVALSKFMALSIGGAYQFDLERHDIDVERMSEEVGRTEFKALSVRLGLIARF